MAWKATKTQVHLNGLYPVNKVETTWTACGLCRLPYYGNSHWLEQLWLKFYLTWWLNGTTVVRVLLDLMINCYNCGTLSGFCIRDSHWLEQMWFKFYLTWWLNGTTVAQVLLDLMIKWYNCGAWSEFWIRDTRNSHWLEHLWCKFCPL